MEKELKESLKRYADLEAQLIANKEARTSVPRYSHEYVELAKKARELRDEYIAEEKVRNDLVVKLSAKKATDEGDEI